MEEMRWRDWDAVVRGSWDRIKHDPGCLWVDSTPPSCENDRVNRDLALGEPIELLPDAGVEDVPTELWVPPPSIVERRKKDAEIHAHYAEHFAECERIRNLDDYDSAEDLPVPIE